jgi:hypothetical protein
MAKDAMDSSLRVIIFFDAIAGRRKVQALESDGWKTVLQGNARTEFLVRCGAKNETAAAWNRAVCPLNH